MPDLAILRINFRPATLDEITRAQAHIDSAVAMVAADALGRRDTDAFLDAGARIDAACEACHAAYWYPRDPPRSLPDPAVFAKTAIRP